MRLIVTNRCQRADDRFRVYVGLDHPAVFGDPTGYTVTTVDQEEARRTYERAVVWVRRQGSP